MFHLHTLIIWSPLYKSLNIQSNGFGIEVETMAKLVLRNLMVEEINIQYHRRTTEEGKAGSRGFT